MTGLLLLNARIKVFHLLENQQVKNLLRLKVSAREGTRSVPAGSPVFCKRLCTCSPDNFTPAANPAGAGDLLGAQGETHLLNHLPRFSCFPQHLLSFVVSLLGPLGHLMYFLHSGLFWFILALLGIEFSPSSSSRCISCTQLGRPLLVSFEASWQRQCW